MDWIKWLVMPFLIIFVGTLLMLIIDLAFETFSPPDHNFEEE